MTSQRKLVGDTVSTKVIQEVAAATNQETTQLPPLYNTIDPEALDEITSSSTTDKVPPIIQFMYSGCLVVVSGPDDITVESTNRSCCSD